MGPYHSLFYYDSSKDLHNDMNPSQPMSSKYLLKMCFRYVFGVQIPPENLFLAYFWDGGPNTFSGLVFGSLGISKSCHQCINGTYPLMSNITRSYVL